MASGLEDQPDRTQQPALGRSLPDTWYLMSNDPNPSSRGRRGPMVPQTRELADGSRPAPGRRFLLRRSAVNFITHNKNAGREDRHFRQQHDYAPWFIA